MFIRKSEILDKEGVKEIVAHGIHVIIGLER
jgi:hypothetical protein